MPTQDENVSPWPLCENLLAKPCSPPLCARRPLRTPISGPAWPEASPFPLIAPSIESSNPICFVVSIDLVFTGPWLRLCLPLCLHQLRSLICLSLSFRKTESLLCH